MCTFWNRFRRIVVTSLAVAALVGAPVCAAGASPDSSRSGVVKIVVSLSSQRIQLFNSADRVVASYPVSTGLIKPTPRGTFTVTSKSRRTQSPDGSYKMEWMVRFSGKIGFHGIPRLHGKVVKTPLGRRPSSHGCVRMSDADAQELFTQVAVGSKVVVR